MNSWIQGFAMFFCDFPVAILTMKYGPVHVKRELKAIATVCCHHFCWQGLKPEKTSQRTQMWMRVDFWEIGPISCLSAKSKTSKVCSHVLCASLYPGNAEEIKQKLQQYHEALGWATNKLVARTKTSERWLKWEDLFGKTRCTHLLYLQERNSWSSACYLVKNYKESCVLVQITSKNWSPYYLLLSAL